MTVQQARALNAYQREAVLSASPARLLTLLYDRLLLDLARAAEAQGTQDWPAAHELLIHAQDIIAELSATLEPGAWDGADHLAGLYSYAGTALMNANIHRDPAPVRDCISLLEPLRQAWHEAAATPADGVSAASVSEGRVPA
ncbi:flagellar export chaperone FliS [Specibacter cremeus]|uniref:flagellar export chaperone FliS n=1 Tax=Specibacter cremeus TaxID=1629051 RepID=UPI000F787BF9|nr:flagellar export chaperone FliS [Specibacter cremeus]